MAPMYRLISIFLCMSAAFLEPFSWGVVFSLRSLTGPLSDFQLLSVRPLHWTSKFEKLNKVLEIGGLVELCG